MKITNKTFKASLMLSIALLVSTSPSRSAAPVESVESMLANTKEQCRKHDVLDPSDNKPKGELWDGRMCIMNCGKKGKYDYEEQRCTRIEDHCRKYGGTWWGIAGAGGSCSGGGSKTMECKRNGCAWFGIEGAGGSCDCKVIPGAAKGLQMIGTIFDQMGNVLTPAPTVPRIIGQSPYPYRNYWLGIPYNIFYLGSHNAFASSEHGYLEMWANQSETVPAQIDRYGARVLEYDIYKYNGGGGDAIHVCHAPCGSAKANAIRRFFKGNGEDLKGYLTFIKDFMERDSSPDKNFDYFTLKQAQKFLRALINGDTATLNANGWKKEDMYKLLRLPPIVTVHFEDYVTDKVPQLLEKYVEESGLAPYVLTRQDWDVVQKNGWPTLASMILTGKTVVLFASNNTDKYVRDFEFHARVNDYPKSADENALTSKDEFQADAMCKQLKGGNTGNDVQLIEFKFQPLIGTVAKAMKDANFTPFLLNCVGQGIGGLKNRYPNFIMVDNVHATDIFNGAMKIALLDPYLAQLQEAFGNLPDDIRHPSDARLWADERFGETQRLHVPVMRNISSIMNSSVRGQVLQEPLMGAAATPSEVQARLANKQTAEACKTALVDYYPDKENRGYFNTTTGQCQEPESFKGCPNGSKEAEVNGVKVLLCK